MVPHTDVSISTASLTSDHTPCADSAFAHCKAPASAAALDTAFTLNQQLDGIKSQFADVIAEPSGMPPDRGIVHVVPLERDAQPPLAHVLPVTF